MVTLAPPLWPAQYRRGGQREWIRWRRCAANESQARGAQTPEKSGSRKGAGGSRGDHGSAIPRMVKVSEGAEDAHPGIPVIPDNMIMSATIRTVPPDSVTPIRLNVSDEFGYWFSGFFDGQGCLVASKN